MSLFKDCTDQDSECLGRQNSRKHLKVQILNVRALILRAGAPSNPGRSARWSRRPPKKLPRSDRRKPPCPTCPTRPSFGPQAPDSWPCSWSPGRPLWPGSSLRGPGAEPRTEEEHKATSYSYVLLEAQFSSGAFKSSRISPSPAQALLYLQVLGQHREATAAPGLSIFAGTLLVRGFKRLWSVTDLVFEVLKAAG